MFSFYLLFYIIPLLLPLLTGLSIYNSIILEHQLNLVVAKIVGLCSAFVIVWTVLFMAFLTYQRNANPELYGKDFMIEITSSDIDNRVTRDTETTND